MVFSDCCLWLCTFKLELKFISLIFYLTNPNLTEKLQVQYKKAFFFLESFGNVIKLQPLILEYVFLTKKIFSYITNNSTISCQNSLSTLLLKPHAHLSSCSFCVTSSCHVSVVLCKIWNGSSVFPWLSWCWHFWGFIGRLFCRMLLHLHLYGVPSLLDSD